MNIYPAIDLYQGKVVRLRRGDFAQETVYSDKPEEIAQEWESQGAEWLHVVDLEGAKTGVIKNEEALLEIRKAVKCRIQFGGGLRDEEWIGRILGNGINRVIVGTKSLDGPFLKSILEKHSEKIAVGLDVRDGRVQMEGWLKESQTLDQALKYLEPFPLKTIIYTDIQKDGMLQGPNFEGLEEVMQRTRACVILSGGVGALVDIEKSSRIKTGNFDGVIIGKALYEKKFQLQEAIQIAGT